MLRNYKHLSDQYGSFTKASEQSFISGTAVMKQINRLEIVDMNTFNQAVEENIPLITVTPWKNIHLNLVLIPLRTNVHVPYGILTTKLPGSNVEEFTIKISKLLKVAPTRS